MKSHVHVSLLLALLPGLCAAPLAGQISTVTAVTAATCTASATFNSNSIPANTVLTLPASVSAYTSFSTGSAGSTFRVTVPPAVETFGVVVTATADGSDTGFPSFLSAGANGDVAFTFRTPGVLDARLVIDFREFGDQWAAGSGSVDLGADGSFEYSFNQQTQASVPVRVGPNGYSVRVRASAFGQLFNLGPNPRTSFSTMGRVELTFVPRVAMSPYGPNCPMFLRGGLIANTATHDTLRFNATGGQPGGVGFLIFGVSLLNFPIPPTDCRLLTDIIIPVPLAIDPSGRATFDVTIDRLPTLISFYTQFIQGSYVGGAEHWRTSDGNLVYVSP